MLREAKRQCCGSLLESQLVRRLRQEDREFEASLACVGRRGRKDERKGRKKEKGREQMGKRETGTERMREGR